jgi:hypothetical protein
MRDKRLWTLDDPGQVTDAQLVGLEQSRGDNKPGWVAKRASEPSCTNGDLQFDPFAAETLGERKVEAEKLAPVIPGHKNTLTSVGMKPAEPTRTTSLLTGFEARGTHYSTRCRSLLADAEYQRLWKPNLHWT